MPNSFVSVKLIGVIVGVLFLGVHLNAAPKTFGEKTTRSFAAKDFKSGQVTFDYMSSEGDVWLDCTSKPLDQPHQWQVNCRDDKNNREDFQVHLMFDEYSRPERSEMTYEFHYWANRKGAAAQARTQSTWITVDAKAKTKRIISYVGFDEDSNQLRIEVNL